MLRDRRAIIFDLDDTLYPLDQFVLSGFDAVASHLHGACGVDQQSCRAVLRQAFHDGGRGQELQICLRHFRLPDAIVPSLVDVIRGHEPSLELSAPAARVLSLLSPNWRIGIVTNGIAAIQARKVAALGLADRIDAIVFADGVTSPAKPAAAPFLEATRRLRVPLQRSVVVGNDPACDVLGAWRLGMKSIHVTGLQSTQSFAPVADASVRSLLEYRKLPNGWWPDMRDALHPERVEMEIGGHTVAPFGRLFVIAEIGLNHGGSLDRALALVDAAADAGASAVKLQTIDAAALVAADAPAPMHVSASSMRDFFATFEFDEAAHAALVGRARERGLVVMATPFSEASVDVLARVGVDAFKIASGDITFESLIRRCGRTRKPMVLSTGMSSLPEAANALEWASAGGAGNIALLHCVSAYPVPSGDENLRAIATLAHAFGTPVGWSDHTTDGAALPLAIALGASIYERHLVSSEADDAIDAAVSSTPAGLARLIELAAATRATLGSGQKTCGAAERGNKIASRRSLYATRQLRAGEIVREEDLIALRPDIGLSADRAGDMIGRKLTRDIEEGAVFVETDVRSGRLEAERVA